MSDDLLDLKPNAAEQAAIVASNVPEPATTSLGDLLKEHQDAKHIRLTVESQHQDKVKVLQDAHDEYHSAFDARKDLITTDLEEIAAADKRIEVAHAALDAARDEHDKSLETVVVAQAVHQAAVDKIVPIAQAHHREQMRDKRSELDLPCPTWEPVLGIVPDPRPAPHYGMETYERLPVGCKCHHMPVKHTKQEGNPWCPSCQDAHRDGKPVCPVIPEHLFNERFLT